MKKKSLNILVSLVLLLSNLNLVKAEDLYSTTLKIYTNNELVKPFEDDNDYTISISYQFIVPGGTSVDGIITDVPHKFFEGQTITAKAGDLVLLEESLPEEVTVEGDHYILDGDTFIRGGHYITGGSSTLGSAPEVVKFGEEFEMIHDNITIILNYVLVEPIYSITVNLLDENGNLIIEPLVRTSRGSTNMLGIVEYDLTDSIELLKNTYSNDKLGFDALSGDSPSGELDGDKVINIIFKTTPEVEPQPEPTPDPESIVVEPVIEEPIEEVIEEEVPLINGRSWALINLISTVFILIIGLGMAITYKKNKKDGDENKDSN